MDSLLVVAPRGSHYIPNSTVSTLPAKTIPLQPVRRVRPYNACRAETIAGRMKWGLGSMRLPGGLGRHLTWHLGLGPELGNIFWAMTGIEATFGAYGGIWPLWIEALGAPVTIVGLVLGASGLFRLMMLLPSAALADRFDPRTLILIARGF